MTDLIVEVASNHGGERAWMEKFVESAALVGADFVKFQSFQTKHLRHDDPQHDWFRKAELTDADHVWLVRECSKVGVSFLSTAFSVDRVDFLHDLGLHAIKVGSGEGGLLSMLEAVARHDWHIYLSTGQWTQADLDEACDILKNNDVTVMHTVSEYPTLSERANLSRIRWLSEKTGFPVGYSDHTIGKTAALAALGMGVSALEVHHSLPGAPRRNAWDKDLIDLRVIAEFNRTVARMRQPQPMVKAPGEERKYVGRWQA